MRRSRRSTTRSWCPKRTSTPSWSASKRPVSPTSPTRSTRNQAGSTETTAVAAPTSPTRTATTWRSSPGRTAVDRLTGMTPADLATELRRLHTDLELLVMVNVWDVATAKVVADLPGCRAVATASHSIAAAHGYPDGEQIPLDLMITAIGRIA